MDEEKQLSFLKNIINDIFNNHGNINYENIHEVYNYILQTIEMIEPEYNLELINFNFNNLIKCVFIPNSDFKGKIFYDKDSIIIPKKYKKLNKQLYTLANIPQPEQRSVEWFDMRKNMLTASTAAKAIGECKYGKPKDLILDKLGLGKQFKGNIFTHHGVKYEEIATKIYEHIYDVKVDEFGLLPHTSTPKINFIGASPDGITNCFKLDNTFNDKMGRMIEIKCPYTRKIKTKGEIDNDICPHTYWCQIQQQLECCDLELCDFWQCKINEYTDRNIWLESKIETNFKEEQDVDVNIPLNCQKGMIIQLMPKNSNNILDAKYLYPDNLNISLYEYDQWVLEKISNFFKTKLSYKYYFDKILYWELQTSHNITINRNKKWFNTVLPKFKETWEKVLYYREHMDEAELLIKKKKKRKKKEKKISELFIDSDE